jgi:hypothetical protein
MKTVYSCFPEGKLKCLTLSYDDGNHADRRLVEIFNKYGLKGTFHLNSQSMSDNNGWRIPIEEVSSLYKGHEVSAHTASHPMIDRCPLPFVAQEIIEDRIALEKQAGYPVRGMSYPFGAHTKAIRDMLPGLGIEYSRTVGATFDFHIPDDFLQWDSTCHHGNRLMEMAEKFLALYKTWNQYLFYVWGHSYEFDQQNNWELIEEFAKLMGGRDDIWYATNIEIVDCVNDFKNLKFAADNSFVYNPGARDCWVRVGEEVVRIPSGKQVVL